MSEDQQPKTKRSVVKRLAKEAALQSALESGNAVARLGSVPTSPRKTRLVVDLIRGQRVSHALHVLKRQKAHPSVRLEKLLLSALSNWELRYPNVKLEDADLFVKEIHVDSGRMLKRIRPAPQGRAHRIRKRSNHVTLTLGSHMEKVELKEGKKTEQVDGAKS